MVEWKIGKSTKRCTGVFVKGAKRGATLQEWGEDGRETRKGLHLEIPFQLLTRFVHLFSLASSSFLISVKPGDKLRRRRRWKRIGNIPQQWVPRVHFYSLIAHLCLLFPDKTPQSASRKVHTLPKSAFVKAQINSLILYLESPCQKCFATCHWVFTEICVNP